MLPLHPCLDVQTDLETVLIGRVFFFFSCFSLEGNWHSVDVPFLDCRCVRVTFPY